jgi:hypothetical protein
MDKAEQIMGRLGEMLDRADEIVGEAGAEYAAALGEDLAVLSGEIAAGNRAAAIHQAYRIKARAGTLGWPLVSTGANALAKLLERCPDLALDGESVVVHMETLGLLFQENMTGEDPRGQPLVRALYKILDKESGDQKPVH